jgi:hypothetical protein
MSNEKERLVSTKRMGMKKADQLSDGNEEHRGRAGGEGGLEKLRVSRKSSAYPWVLKKKVIRE